MMSVTSAFHEMGSWADMQEEDEKTDYGQRLPTLNLQPILPPPSRTEKDGIVTLIEYHLDDKDQKVKVTRKFRILKKQTRIYAAAEKRKRLQRFGECAGKVGAEKGVTYKSIDDVMVEYPKSTEEPELKVGGGVAPVDTGAVKIKVSCNNCGGKHFTYKCPLGASAGRSLSAVPPDESAAAGPSADSSGAGGTGAYVAPFKRAGREGHGMQSTGLTEDLDFPVVRVDNLSENAQKDDVQELFRQYGRVTRVRILHKYTRGADGEEIKTSRGIAFVTMPSKSEAEAAIIGLNRHGYDNLLLRVTKAETERERLAKKTANETNNLPFRRRF